MHTLIFAATVLTLLAYDVRDLVLSFPFPLVVLVISFCSFEVYLFTVFLLVQFMAEVMEIPRLDMEEILIQLVMA